MGIDELRSIDIRIDKRKSKNTQTEGIFKSKSKHPSTNQMEHLEEFIDIYFKEDP